MIDADGCAKVAICSASCSLAILKSCTSGETCQRGHLLTKKTLQITRKGYRRCRRCLAIADAKYRVKRFVEKVRISEMREQMDHYNSSMAFAGDLNLALSRPEAEPPAEPPCNHARLSAVLVWNPELRGYILEGDTCMLCHKTLLCDAKDGAYRAVYTVTKY